MEGKELYTQDSCSESDFSEAEFALPVLWEDAKNFKLAFGKYKGRNLDDMIKTGRRRNYLRYLTKWDELRPSTKQNIDCALQEYSIQKEKHVKLLKQKDEKKKNSTRKK